MSPLRFCHHAELSRPRTLAKHLLSAVTILADLRSGHRGRQCLDLSPANSTLAQKSPIGWPRHPLPRAESGAPASLNTAGSSTSSPTSVRRVVRATTTVIAGRDRVSGGAARTAPISAGRAFSGCCNLNAMCMYSGEQTTVLPSSILAEQLPGQSKTPPQWRFSGRSILRIDPGLWGRRNL